MKFPVRPLAPSTNRPDSTYKSGKVVQISGATSIATIQAAGAQAVIPARKNRLVPRPYDRHAYRERHLIECLFSRLKQFRRIATRYEKLARNFLSMINLATAYIWLV
jgi:transposase